MTIGHNSQNGTKINDELRQIGAGEDDSDVYTGMSDFEGYHGDFISHSRPNSTCMPDHITMLGLRGGGRAPLRHNQVGAVSRFVASPGPLPLLAEDAVAAVSPTQQEEEEEQANVPFDATTRMPSQDRQDEFNSAAAVTRADSRATGTQSLYGSVKDPLKGSGTLKEFGLWCKASRGDVVSNLKVDDTKHPYPVVPTSAICVEFVQRHLLRRKQYNKTTRQYTVDEPLGKSSLDNAFKSLKALYDYQAGVFPGGAEAFQRKYGNRPNKGGELTAQKVGLSTKTAEVRRSKHKPRGKGALAMEGYTRDQNRQLFEFGLTNEGMGTIQNLTNEKKRLVHTHHTFAHNLALRYDDREKMLLSQFCCDDAPEDVGKGNEKRLCVVLDWRKHNQHGAFERVDALRHIDNPWRCTWFAFGLELYSQIHIMGMSLEVEDFVPVPVVGQSGYRHPSW